MWDLVKHVFYLLILAVLFGFLAMMPVAWSVTLLKKDESFNFFQDHKIKFWCLWLFLGVCITFLRWPDWYSEFLELLNETSSPNSTSAASSPDET